MTQLRPTVRLDDLSSDHPSSWEFHHISAHGRAEHLDDVIPQLAAGEVRANVHGEWVVFVVAYEAAAAFDVAMRTKAVPPLGTPFVWWASFAERHVAPPIDAVPTTVVDRHRSSNTVEYPVAVEVIRDRIQLGDVYQVNMTDRFRGTFEGDPFDVYAGLIGVQSCSHGAFLDMGERVVASASPELFFRVDGDTISCRPMKGTAPRHPRPDIDRSVGAALSCSAKDQAENVMIVDLLRNDLSRVSVIGSVEVPELFCLERYETVWQLTSTVRAQLLPGLSLTDLLSALFPCGSITGAPKIAAMRIIDELEAEPRGLYCGAIGVLAPLGHEPRIECSVPIRTAVLDPATKSFVYGAGGGITWSSEPSAEDDEVRHKARILTRSRRQFKLFETLRLDGGGPLHLDEHLDRLEQSADWFGFIFDRSAIQRATGSAKSVETERMKILLAPDGSWSIEREPLTETTASRSESPVLLAIDTETTQSDDPFCCHKTTFRRHYLEAIARHPGVDDVVMVNEFGHAIETTIANLAYRLGEQWFVPPLSDGGLAGIGRRVALRDGSIQERSIAAVDLAVCDELAVVNDLRGWRTARLPVR